MPSARPLPGTTNVPSRSCPPPEDGRRAQPLPGARNHHDERQGAMSTQCLVRSYKPSAEAAASKLSPTMLFPSASAFPCGYSDSKDGHERSRQGNTRSAPARPDLQPRPPACASPPPAENPRSEPPQTGRKKKGPYRRLPCPPSGFRRRAPAAVGLGMLGEGLAAAGCAPPWSATQGPFPLI